jgi:hypothetical protein
MGNGDLDAIELDTTRTPGAGVRAAALAAMTGVRRKAPR